MYRDAIEYVHDAVVRGANLGKAPDQLVEEIHLPAHLADQPEVHQLYGKVSESVRAIYNGYFGWLDGIASNLEPLGPKARGERLAKLAEVADMVLALNPDSRETRL